MQRQYMGPYKKLYCNSLDTLVELMSWAREGTYFHLSQREAVKFRKHWEKEVPRQLSIVGTEGPVWARITWYTHEIHGYEIWTNGKTIGMTRF